MQCINVLYFFECDRNHHCDSFCLISAYVWYRLCDIVWIFFFNWEKSLPKSQGEEEKPNGCELKNNTDESYRGKKKKKKLGKCFVGQTIKWLKLSKAMYKSKEEETAMEYQYCKRMQNARDAE